MVDFPIHCRAAGQKGAVCLEHLHPKSTGSQVGGRLWGGDDWKTAPPAGGALPRAGVGGGPALEAHSRASDSLCARERCIVSPCTPAPRLSGERLAVRPSQRPRALSLRVPVTNHSVPRIQAAPQILGWSRVPPSRALDLNLLFS